MRRSLDQALESLEVSNRLRRGEQWQHWLQLADAHDHGWYVEVILRFALRCFSDRSIIGQGKASGSCPEFDRLEHAWGGGSQVKDSAGIVEWSMLVWHPDFWQTARSIGGTRAQSLTPGILLPLQHSLSSLAEKIVAGELTVQEMLRTAPLNAWQNSAFFELLEHGPVTHQLQDMIKRVRFMQEFEISVQRLSQVFPGQAAASILAEGLYKSFLKAATNTKKLEPLPEVSQLRVPLAEIKEELWTLPVELPSKLQVSHVDVPLPSFSLVLTAIKTLRLARSGSNRPLHSMLQAVEQEMNALNNKGSGFNLLEKVFVLYQGIERVLKGLSEVGGEEARLSSQALSLIERHWAPVAPTMVSTLLGEIQSVSSLSFGDLNEVGGRVQAVLRGRKTVEFWNLCTMILSHLSSTLPNRAIQGGFSEETCDLVASLQAMHEAFNAAKEQKNESKLTTKTLDQLDSATQCLREFFEFLGGGDGDSGFEQVLRLVTTMAEGPGLSFLRVLLSSAQKGEHLAMRLAELVEGALTQETLAHVEQASAVFMPLCVAVLWAMRSPIDANKFRVMVEGEWSELIQTEALRASSQAQIGDLMLKMLRETYKIHGSKLSEFLEGLRSALRQGGVLKQKLEENSDDATAVSNTVHGMVSGGYLELAPSTDATHFEVLGVFKFSKDQAMITRDVQQLTECSDKASLAVPKVALDADNPTALTQEKVQIFTGCIEGILGLRQELTELLLIGHPYLEDAGELRFPRQGEGLSASTLQEVKDTLRWAQGAMQQWCNALDQARARHAIMSTIPARNIVKLARAVLNSTPSAVASLMSFQCQVEGKFESDQQLNEWLEQCKCFSPGEGVQEKFLEKLAEVSKQVIPPHALTTFSPLHQIARCYPKQRASDDATARSRIDRRQNPKFYPKRVLLIQEELSHEPGNSALQSMATTTVLSLLLPLGIGPSAENLLLCDSSTTKDDVLRFLHRVTHATRLAMDTSRQSQVLGVCVHVDCLQPDVLQELLCRVDAMQAAVGARRTEADSVAEFEVRLAFTLTMRASKTLIETLEKDLCKQQQINILKLSSIKAFLKEAGAAALGCHSIVSSKYAGDGKTHAIRRSEKWDPDSHVTIVWGGAQTRGQAARALRKAEGAGCVHLELHGFEEGGGVDADMLLMELLLFRCVFDPERSEWTRFAADTPLFVEVANSIKIRQGTGPVQLMMLSAPILKGVPGQRLIHADSPFLFSGEDLFPERAASSARDFALAGAALLLGEETQNLVGCEGEHGVAFKLMADAQGQGLVVAGDHANLVQGNWAQQAFLFEKTFEGQRGVDIRAAFVPVLKEMISMAAAMCLRSSAAEAQQGEREKIELRDAFRGFVLTRDNMIKLVDVAERLRAQLPCILMGQLEEQQVHAGTTEAEILEALNKGEELARQKADGRKDGGTEHMVVQFWDELNTCPHQALFKQILIDRINPSTSKPIHRGLCFVAACNPWRRASQGSVVCVGFESPVSQEDRLAGLAYRVHPLPESLFTHLSSFGQLDSETEKQYVKEMASQAPQLLNPDDQWLRPPPLTKSMCDHVAQYVCIIHDFFRALGSCVSLRDPNRLLKLWGFIRWELEQREKLEMAKGHSPSDASRREVISLVLALHLAYEVRLPDLEKRNELLAALLHQSNIGDLLKTSFPHACKNELECIKTWRDIVLDEQDYWLNAFDVADNIAKVRALRENIYAALICSMTRTPIFILGKPGCSKSLTVSLLISALADPYKEQLLHLASLSVQPYQGSRQSTSSALLQVFERALARQKKLRTLNRRTRPLALVLLDEVGLAEQSPHNPLKVLHARLEPRRAQDAVSVIAISNWELDRSKLSRGHVAAAFMEILQNQMPRDFHGLRDWYGMCSFAARLLLAADVEMGWGCEEVKHGALMHAVSDELGKEAEQLVKLCRERHLQFVPADWALTMAVLNNMSGNHSSGALDKMLHSLSQNEHQQTHQSIPVLEEIYSEILHVSNRLDSLLGDVAGRHIMDQVSTEMYAQSMIQAAIVSMAQERRLLILQNLDIIYAALYDVFNSNSSRASGLNSQRYCRIARQGFCNNRCAVADQFKAVLVVTRERAARYEPALLNRFAKLEVDRSSDTRDEEDDAEGLIVELEDLLPSMDEVLEWQEQLAKACPAVQGKNGERPTDVVAACPMNSYEPDLGLFLQTLTMSAFMRNAQSESLEDGCVGSAVTKEALFSLLASPDCMLEGRMDSHTYCRSSKSHFGELMRELYNKFGDSAGHVIVPVLVPTFSDPNQSLDLEAMPGLKDQEKVFSKVCIANIISEAALRENMKEHIEQIEKRLSGSNGQILSVLHVHVNMKQDDAQDIVDYMRFQLEWCAEQIEGSLNGKLKGFGLHILALVVHGVRGSGGEHSMRPFLLAGPGAEQSQSRPSTLDVRKCEWTGVGVDHFSHVLPWGMRPEELLKGTIAEIYGLEEPSPDRFRRILADALPHVVPRFGFDSQHADSFVIVQSLLQEINDKPELVSCVRSVLSEQLSMEQAQWRVYVAKDIQLLRRTGPFQLALLSHLRQDEKILPVMKALWLHSLHNSCPSIVQSEPLLLTRRSSWLTPADSREHEFVRSDHWRPVAQSLLNAPSQPICREPMLSQLHSSNRRAFLMPGSVAVMQIILPQLQTKNLLPEQDFTEVLLRETIRLSAVVRHCLPVAVWEALKAVGEQVTLDEATDGIGLLGNDVIIEMAARACASVQDWLDAGQASFESVRSHLDQLVLALVRNVASQQESYVHTCGEGQKSVLVEDPHVLRALLPAVAAAMLRPISQQVAALQKQFPTTRSWTEYLEPLLDPFPVAGTWNTFLKRGVRAAFELHAADLEELLCLSAAAGDDVQDREREFLQLLRQLSVTIEDFVITVGCSDATVVSVAAISHMLSHGVSPEQALSIWTFMRNNSEKHLLLALAGLVEIHNIDTTIPLVGVSYALQLLSEESKADPSALEACLALMNQAIHRSEGCFQKLCPLKPYLQQISIYLMEHLVPRVRVTSFSSWSQTQWVSEEILQSFYSLMEEQEVEPRTSASLMHLLDAVLPSRVEGVGWDIPLVASLSAALSMTSQLGLVISQLVVQSLKNTFGNSSKQALAMLEEAFKKALNVLREGDSVKSQVFVALVLARELVLQSVDLVEAAVEDEMFEQRLDNILTDVVQALGMQLGGLPPDDVGTLLCTYQGRDLRVEQRPTAFASLYVLAAARRRERPLPTNTAVKHLLEVVALNTGGGDSDLHRFLEGCRAESVTFSNALGLSLLLPDQVRPEVRSVVGCLHDIGSEDQSRSEQAAQRFKEICGKKCETFQALLEIMRAVGEVACMQCSAEDDDTLDLAGRIADELPSVLGRAGELLRLKGDDETEWNIDFLNMDGEHAWRASIFTHLVCLLGAAHASVNQRQENLPSAIKPFTAFNDIDEPTLNSTFWPGVPDDWWQSLRYSGLHKHLLPVTGNIGWAQCQCGYRYCYAECGAPVSAAKCPSPEGEGRCTLMNGGQNHTFAPHQQLIAVVVTARPHGTGWPPVFHSMSQGFPAAFQPPPPSPGLFALTEADLHISVTEADRAVVSHSLMSETVRQDWNQPLGKPPDPKSGLHPVTFRVLHLLIHASALVGIEMEWVQGRENIVQLLQGHLRQVARINPVRNANDTVWYFMANVEADLDALAKLLSGNLEIATLFMHAVLHRLGSLQPQEQPSGQNLTTHEARVAYEIWFHNTIIRPILGEKGASGDFPLPGVHALRRQASQGTDPNKFLATDLLARRGLPAEAWVNVKEGVRAGLLLHVLRPSVIASAEDTLEELVAATCGGNRFVILRWLMAGVEEDGVSWSLLPDLFRAASLAWILPFIQLVRDKEGGKITMREARTTTIRAWLESQPGHEQHRAWITFRNFEAAWNAALASDQLRDGCGVIRLPSVALESPLAIACPIADPEKPQHGDIPVGNQADKPEHIAALGLHHLAASHNKLIAQVKAYLDDRKSLSAHVRARLHPSAGLCQSSGQCQPAAETCHDQSVRLIQKASATDLFVFPSQLEDACAVEDDVHPHGPRTFRLDYKIDHKDLHQDYDAFPYRIFHGIVDVRILNRLKGCRLAEQVALSEAIGVQKAEDLEISFFRDASHAVEVFTLVDKVPHQDRKCEHHPDALMRIAGLPDIATVPLNGLVALHLLSRDMLAMIRGVSIKTRDTGEEYTESLDPPASLKQDLEKLKETCPQALAMVCRLVARTVYLASDLPLAIPDLDQPREAPRLCMLVKEMDVLDELEELGVDKGEEAKALLDMPVPLDLEYWNDWNQGHVMTALKLYRSVWSQIREPYLAPPKPVLAACTDPAIAGGMAKGLAQSGWRQPKAGRGKRPRKAKRFSAQNKEQGFESEEEEWEVISPPQEANEGRRATVEAAGSARSIAECQRQEQQVNAMGNGLEGSDFMRDVLQKFVDSRRPTGGAHSSPASQSGVTIRSSDAERVALAWDDSNMMGEILEPLLLAVLGESFEMSVEVRSRFVLQFHGYVEQQQSLVLRSCADHIEPSQLQRCILRGKGWTLRKSPSDGHCQFHSVGFAVGEDHQTVRANAVQWITQHRDEYKLKMVAASSPLATLTENVLDDGLERALDEYIKGMSEGDWGDNITLHALAHHYQREIRILTDNVKRAWVQIEPEFGNPIHVLFHAEIHYEGIQTTTTTTNE
ncbi:E3 ubiquitin-protein ligase rnf213-beta (Mysterin-B) (Mysterin-beta) (RING finger protein 213-B) (RING finger protein 213-beta) (RING-type E3 ubiquitin transferase rnf213-beta) [Durusdinium trenchii]|uniref:E3 ubiquitin-protein ligase rnf213-beta (Mysterin-B) (Mysterin-beta) (RING finger protein 213-B) (RING finger protein 213-beta) (RING-type E3 ubiquitin transferase rnf213-beta) n=1 Tax=Durusdinium trenchii TaxID=1381693 RepID=A0ABP0LGC6_9DINO